MNRIRVELDVFEGMLLNLAEQCESYRETYQELMVKTDEIALYWQGKDQEAFTKQIHAFEDDFISLFNLLDGFYHYLQKSLQAYQALQDETERATYRLHS